MVIQECIDDLVMRGCDDWVYAAEVAFVAREVGRAQTADEIRELSLKVIRELVERSLMEVGDLPTEGNRLKLWPLTPHECLNRIEREWKNLGRNPSISEICWLQNTDNGSALGESLLKSRNAIG